jgi:hypothetical protein
MNFPSTKGLYIYIYNFYFFLFFSWHRDNFTTAHLPIKDVAKGAQTQFDAAHFQTFGPMMHILGL